MQSDWCPHKKRKLDTHRHQRCACPEDHVERQGEGSHLQTKERSLRGNQLRPPEQREKKFPLLKTSGLWYFIMAAPGKIIHTDYNHRQ